MIKSRRIVSLLLALFMLTLPLISCSDVKDGGDGTGDAVSGGTDGSAPSTDDNAGKEPEPEPEYYAYLFAYFSGNAPDQERISYAISFDGYNFTPVNNGSPVLASRSGTRCIRDPYLFRGHDGAYYIIATDMKSSDGWDSNRNLISWRSEDLIKWEDETVIEVDGKFDVTQGTVRAWAPQAIWDEDRGEYMIYFALKSNATNGKTVMYYSYSPDLKTLSTEPKLFFAPTDGHDAIDADIIYEDGKYYMFVKDETSKGILLTSSDKINSGYSYSRAKLVSPNGLGVEGSSTYKLFDGSGWNFIADAYGDGYFIMAHTDDLENFKQLRQNQFSFTNFTPRHGSVLSITKDEYNVIAERFKLAKAD